VCEKENGIAGKSPHATSAISRTLIWFLQGDVKTNLARATVRLQKDQIYHFAKKILASCQKLQATALAVRANCAGFMHRSGCDRINENPNVTTMKIHTY